MCIHTFSCVQRSIDRRRRGVERHRISGDTTGRALVLKPAISFKKSWWGYRRTTQTPHLKSKSARVINTARQLISPIYFLLCAKVNRSTTSGCRGTPYFRRFDRELVLKPAISLKKKLGGGATVERLINNWFHLQNTG